MESIDVFVISVESAVSSMLGRLRGMTEQVDRLADLGLDCATYVDDDSVECAKCGHRDDHYFEEQIDGSYARIIRNLHGLLESVERLRAGAEAARALLESSKPRLVVVKGDA